MAYQLSSQTPPHPPKDEQYVWRCVVVSQSCLQTYSPFPRHWPSWRWTARPTSWALRTWLWSTWTPCCQRIPFSLLWNTPGATCWTIIPSFRSPHGGRSLFMSSFTSCSACLDSFSSLCPSCKNTRSNRSVAGFSQNVFIFKMPIDLLIYLVCVCVHRTSQRPGRNSGNVSRCFCSIISSSSCLWSVEPTTSLSFSTSHMTGSPCPAGTWNCVKTHLNTCKYLRISEIHSLKIIFCSIQHSAVRKIDIKLCHITWKFKMSLSFRVCLFILNDLYGYSFNFVSLYLHIWFGIMNSGCKLPSIYYFFLQVICCDKKMSM